MEYTLSSEFGQPTGDKVDGRVFLFEEIVPGDYQTQLSVPKSKKAGGLFSRSKTTKGRIADRPIPANLTREEAEFDALVRKQMPTKQISLSKPLEGTTARVGMITPKPSHSSFYPARSSSASKVDALKAGVSSDPPHGSGGSSGKTGKGLFKRRATEEAKRIQPQNAAADQLDHLEMRTASGPSSVESEPDTGGVKVHRPAKGDNDKWTGKSRFEAADSRI